MGKSIFNLQFAILLLCLASCRTPATTSSEETPATAKSEVQRGPIKVTVEVEPAKARLSDEPELTLTIDAAAGVVVEKPPFGTSLGSFLIRDFREPLAKTRDGREIIQQIYTLEPTATGRQFIDPISVTFSDLRPDGDQKTHTVETEALTVEIVSLHGDEAPRLSDLRSPVGPVELPSAVPAWIWLLLGGIVLGVAVAVWLSLRRRRERALAAVILTPEQLARRELAELARSGLAQRDVKQYYVELTGIVRRYIERTTGIRAPEQTTEEFLREISRTSAFPDEVNQRLKDFLESADLVKFAAYRPRSEDIEESFRRAERFIGPPPSPDAPKNLTPPRRQEVPA